MKKMLKIMFSMLLLTLLFAANVFAQDEESFLESFGIITKDAESYVTRSQAAYYFSEIVNMSDEYTDLSISDVDVTVENHLAIKKVCALKIMNPDGNGRFYPDEYISGQDFIVAALRLAGFTDYAEALGGYPVGYNKLMIQYKLKTRGLVLTNKMTHKQAAELLKQVLNMPYCDIKSVNNEGAQGYSIREDYTVMQQYRAVVKYTGTVTAVDDVYLRGFSGSGTDIISLTNGENTNVYKNTFENALEYLGARVYYYLDEQSGEIIYIEPYRDVQIKDLDCNDIRDISPDRKVIKYYEGKTTKELELSYDCTFIYNGRNILNILPQDMFKYGVKLKLIDPDCDNIYEVVYIEEAEQIIVGSYAAAEKYVSDKVTGKSYSLYPDDFEKGVQLYYNGEEVDFRYIKSDQLLSIVTDKDNYRRKVYISDDVKTGEVECIAEDENILVVDGEEIRPLVDIKNKDISPGDSISLYFDSCGKCVRIEKQPDGKGEYAYLLNIGQRRGFSKIVECELVNKYGEIVICQFHEKFSVNGTRSDYDNLRNKLLENGTIHQLVYITYKDGEIKDIAISNASVGMPTSNDYDGFNLNYEAEIGECNIFQGNFNNQFLASPSTMTFYIPLDRAGNVNEDEILAGDYSQMTFKADIKPKLKLYDVNLARIPSAVVVYGSSGNRTNFIGSGRLTGNHAVLVEDIIHKRDSDGEFRPYIKGMLLGMPIYLHPSKGESFDDLNSGDVIKIGAYRGNELISYEKLFTLQRERKDSESVLSPDGDYYEDKPAYNKTDFTSKFSAIGVYGCVEEVGLSKFDSDTSNQNGPISYFSLVVRPAGTQEDDKLITIPLEPQDNGGVPGTYVYVYNTDTKEAVFVNASDIDFKGKTVYCFFYNAVAKEIVVMEGGDY